MATVESVEGQRIPQGVSRRLFLGRSGKLAVGASAAAGVAAVGGSAALVERALMAAKAIEYEGVIAKMRSAPSVEEYLARINDGEGPFFGAVSALSAYVIGDGTLAPESKLRALGASLAQDAGMAAHLVLQGGEGTKPVAVLMRDFLLGYYTQMGKRDYFLRKSVMLELKSSTTRSEMEELATITREYQINPALVITNDFHCDGTTIDAYNVGLPAVVYPAERWVAYFDPEAYQRYAVPIAPGIAAKERGRRFYQLADPDAVIDHHSPQPVRQTLSALLRTYQAVRKSA